MPVKTCSAQLGVGLGRGEGLTLGEGGVVGPEGGLAVGLGAALPAPARQPPQTNAVTSSSAPDRRRTRESDTPGSLSRGPTLAAVLVRNPYLEEFESTSPAWRVPPEMRKLSFERYQLRQELVAKYAWAIPSQEAVELLVRHSPLVEMGAGTGYWAWLVRQAGGDVLAFDRYPPPDRRNRWHAGRQPWTEVKPGGARLLAKHPDRTLFLCWPPEDEPMGIDSVRAYRGDTVIFAGEPTSAGEVVRELDRWDLTETLDIPRWEGIHDRLFVLRRPRHG